MPAVKDLSEGQLLAGFLPILAEHNSRSTDLTVGPGDDCAVLDLGGGQTVLTTDTQTEDQDFRRLWPSGLSTGGYEIGWKAATQNLADLAAMGATPRTLLVSLTLTGDVEDDWVTAFARGLVESCRTQGAEACSISGGDLGMGTEISVTVTAVGTCTAPVLRSGTQPGDALVLAGRVGTAAAGLALLDSEHLAQEGAAPLTAGERACIEAQQKPVSPLGAGAAGAPALHAMLDVSDGLVRDAERIARASGVSIDLDRESLTPLLEPLADAAARLAGAGTDPSELALHWVLTGGEDHGLLATCPPGNIPAGFTRIGTVGAGDPAVTLDGTPYYAKGWDHFDRTAR